MAFLKLRIYNDIKEIEDEKNIDSYWEIANETNNIKVRPIDNEIRLYINDELQDVVSDEIKSSKLYGKLPNGKEVMVSIIIVNSHVNCYIFVDNECVFGE